MSDELLKAMKKANPQDLTILVQGRPYKIWRDEKYLGIVVFVNDERIGPSFQQRQKNEDGDIEVTVFKADRWEMIIEEQAPPIKQSYIIPKEKLN